MDDLCFVQCLVLTCSFCRSLVGSVRCVVETDFGVPHFTPKVLVRERDRDWKMVFQKPSTTSYIPRKWNLLTNFGVPHFTPKVLVRERLESGVQIHIDKFLYTKKGESSD